MSNTDPRPVRRIIASADTDDQVIIHQDEPSPDVRFDPARPGFAATRAWVTTATPAPVAGITETLGEPHTIEPPKGGSVCRFLTIPPDDWFMGTLTDEKVADYFDAMGSPQASRLGTGAPHPYMQQTSSLDYVFVLDGEVTLILDTEQVHLNQGDTVVLLGASHAWSNR
ncbi:MAG: cupin domain-containing protein, partial [Rhizobiales bacterium]|nr:cupin domain-containing protein [Hyphomicrobiales bacterium]